MTPPVIRELSGVAEFTAAEALQRAVWGPDDLVDPYDLMMVIQHEGGLVAGAFSGDELVGYVFGFPTRELHIQHSHRLAVLPKMQGMGLGARLKWFQRDWCLARGITHVRWTFDPLRAANAALNVGKLGVIVDTYMADYYGKMVGINAGTPSDRLMADWFLNTAHVADRAARIAQSTPDPARRVTIPRDFAALLASDPDKALAERLRVREQIGRALKEGLVINGFVADQSCYIFAKPAA
ncbi:GNAT family N-acetyltransferase [Pseudosulfitobacter pseudonitzschiae]|uniref:GNAT family N-acetyltransferase n=1 Tax=Pseudosulfitobacter pseudonitzschiae TaxID=1402135 RepID=UPI001AFC8177|nr:GNAT family N-acetyltransferase [Pseudosulfitobacter pseudonitzschiae]MBM1814866.1 GNAT family N-acetyltransferase [Pseudosulfitobacter pseudonitzschiae]MBM1831860.1 GNAT family N-acetyltransferase [Pseudosulfitobacter pseudonitzschiae]MBM1836725.1 GNAT family N-acetyltransferase [Pseudosulfitobacter pseudonitzschiae]MBM1841572.1 GNAT family N-acetyltransferase [Pseudosulfitobacter pseudonitzschiae]MBM1846439.1 GNAT family N-acetyltransferase [Pseudosulfitobacter pseudonitzschiae]